MGLLESLCKRALFTQTLCRVMLERSGNIAMFCISHTRDLRFFFLQKRLDQVLRAPSASATPVLLDSHCWIAIGHQRNIFVLQMNHVHFRPSRLEFLDVGISENNNKRIFVSPHHGHPTSTPDAGRRAQCRSRINLDCWQKSNPTAAC